MERDLAHEYDMEMLRREQGSQLKPFKMKECPWEELKESSQGTVYWCVDCGAIYMDNTERKPELHNPSRVDHETYLCPDQGIRV